MEEHVADRWLNRGVRFFRAVTRNPVIRGVLLERGLTNEELERGWGLYSRVFGLSQSTPIVPEMDTAAADAMNELDAWDAPAYRVIAHLFEVRYPAVSQFVFNGIEAGEGPAAVSGVSRFLDRIAALKQGVAEGVSAEEGRAAVQLLAERKVLTDADVEHLRALIQTTQQGAPAAPPPPQEDPADDVVLDEYIQWISEWREVARFAIHRRDYLISLGLAHRKSPPHDEPESATGGTGEPG